MPLWLSLHGFEPTPTITVTGSTGPVSFFESLGLVPEPKDLMARSGPQVVSGIARARRERTRGACRTNIRAARARALAFGSLFPRSTGNPESFLEHSFWREPPREGVPGFVEYLIPYNGGLPCELFRTRFSLGYSVQVSTRSFGSTFPPAKRPYFKQGPASSRKQGVLPLPGSEVLSHRVSHVLAAEDGSQWDPQLTGKNRVSSDFWAITHSFQGSLRV